MQKKVLTEVDLYSGEIEMPKGFEIDRDQIRNDIIESFVKKNRINDNPKQYSFDDYVVDYSTTFTMDARLHKRSLES